MVIIRYDPVSSIRFAEEYRTSHHLCSFRRIENWLVVIKRLIALSLILTITDMKCVCAVRIAASYISKDSSIGFLGDCQVKYFLPRYALISYRSSQSYRLISGSIVRSCYLPTTM